MAAILVVYFHTEFVFWGSKPFGSFGVDIFFILSGFVMAQICETRPEQFFRRRLFRIVPLYWSLTVLTFACAPVLPHLLQGANASIEGLLKSLFFILYGGGSGLVVPLLAIGWTLNSEMFFYAVIALSLVVTRRYATLLSAMSVIGVMLVCHMFRYGGPLTSFYGDPIMLKFLAGIATYYFWRRVPCRLAGWIRRAALWMMLFSFSGLISQTILFLKRQLYEHYEVSVRGRTGLDCASLQR